MPIVLDLAAAPDPTLGPIETPKFAYPFAFSNEGANVVEQDSLADVFGCVQAVVACPVGARNEDPSFGLPSPLFQQVPVDVTGLQRAIVRWEPRAALRVQDTPDRSDPSTRHVQIDVSAVQPDR